MNLIIFIIINKNKNINKYIYGDWGLGIGDWGLGIGGWGQIPIPQPPTPNPPTPI